MTNQQKRHYKNVYFYNDANFDILLHQNKKNRILCHFRVLLYQKKKIMLEIGKYNTLKIVKDLDFGDFI